jgi:cytochrome b561
LSHLGNLLRNGYRNAQRLFHMLTGVIFIGLAAGGAMVTFNEWVDYRKRPQEGVVELAIYAGFTIFLVILGLYSFVKARHVR